MAATRPAAGPSSSIDHIYDDLFANDDEVSLILKHHFEVFFSTFILIHGCNQHFLQRRSSAALPTTAASVLCSQLLSVFLWRLCNTFEIYFRRGKTLQHKTRNFIGHHFPHPFLDLSVFPELLIWGTATLGISYMQERPDRDMLTQIPYLHCYTRGGGIIDPVNDQQRMHFMQQDNKFNVL